MFATHATSAAYALVGRTGQAPLGHTGVSDALDTLEAAPPRLGWIAHELLHTLGWGAVAVVLIGAPLLVIFLRWRQAQRGATNRHPGADDTGAWIADYSSLLERVEQQTKLAAYAKNQKEEAKLARDQSGLMQSVLDSINAAVCIVDAAGRIVGHNVKWEALDCFRDGTLAEGKQLAAGLKESTGANKGSLADLAEPLQVLLSGVRVGHSGLYRGAASGKRVWLQANLAPVDDPGGQGAAVLCLFDVTERVEAERSALKASSHNEMLADALENSRQTLSATMQASGIATWQWDTETGHVEYGGAWAELLGIPRGRVRPGITEWLSRVHPGDTATTDQHLLPLGEEGAARETDCEFRLRRDTGDYHWVHCRGHVVQVEAPGVPRVVAGVLSSIQERRLAQARSEALAGLVEAATSELLVLDGKSLRVVEANRGAREALGASREEVIGQPIDNLMPADSCESLAAALESPEAASECGASFEWKWQTKSGGARAVAGRVQRTHYLGVAAVALHGVDISETRRLETRLMQAEKLQSIGQLAAGVAHEINTPMQYIGSNVGFLQESIPNVLEMVHQLEAMVADELLPPDQPTRVAQLDAMLGDAEFDALEEGVTEALADCATGVGRVVEIVRAMKDFSHPGRAEKSHANVNDLLLSAAKVSQNSWKHEADVEFELEPSLPPIACLAAELNQVFLNLLVNAADAVACRSIDDDAGLGKIWVRTFAGEDAVIVEVEDSGPGIPPDAIGRVFDPFFTTKDVGKGTGQGLAISHDVVVNKHGGEISVESPPGRGACFRVKLPCEVATC